MTRTARQLTMALVVSALAAGALAPAAFAATTKSSTQPAPGTQLVAGLDTEQSNDATAIKEIGRTPGLIDAFYGFENPDGSSVPFPQAWASQVIADGSTPMITWQPDLSTYRQQSVLTSISDGSLDSYISAWAEAAKATGHPMLVRLMHEFNGNWYPWGAVVAGKTPLPGGGTYSYTNTPAMYVAAYRHVVAVFDRVGATNVQFVWCLSSVPLPHNLSSYWPGSSYVSWPALDGYNRSTTDPRSFSAIFSSAYQAVTALTSEHILIAETASVEFSGAVSPTPSKAAWIYNTYLQTIPEDFPQIKAIDWFDSPGKGYSYGIDTSPATLQAIQEVYSDPAYEGSLTGS